MSDLGQTKQPRYLAFEGCVYERQTHWTGSPSAVPVVRKPVQQCGLCGSFLPKPVKGERWRVCPQCGTESEVPPVPPLARPDEHTPRGQA